MLAPRGLVAHLVPQMLLLHALTLSRWRRPLLLPHVAFHVALDHLNTVVHTRPFFTQRRRARHGSNAIQRRFALHGSCPRPGSTPRGWQARAEDEILVTVAVFGVCRTFRARAQYSIWPRDVLCRSLGRLCRVACHSGDGGSCVRACAQVCQARILVAFARSTQRPSDIYTTHGVSGRY